MPYWSLLFVIPVQRNCQLSMFTKTVSFSYHTLDIATFVKFYAVCASSTASYISINIVQNCFKVRDPKSKPFHNNFDSIFLSWVAFLWFKIVCKVVNYQKILHINDKILISWFLFPKLRYFWWIVLLFFLFKNNWRKTKASLS